MTREVLLARAARVSSLTLMSSGPGALNGPRAVVLRELLAELDGTGPEGLGAEIERIWNTRLQPEAVAGGVPVPIIDFLRTRMLSSSPTGLLAMAQTLLSCPDRTTALARLDAVPVMVLYGENDDAWEPAAQEDMAARLRAQRVCIPAAAHSPAVEAPETTASTLTSFWNATECQQAGRPARPSGPGLTAGVDRPGLGRPAPHPLTRPRRPGRPRDAGPGWRRNPPGRARGSRPAAARARAGREYLVLATGGQPGPVALVGRRALGGDVLGPAQVPVQRGLACAPRRVPSPLGRWCSSTRWQGRRSTRPAATAYSASGSDDRASSLLSGRRPSRSCSPLRPVPGRRPRTAGRPAGRSARRT